MQKAALTTAGAIFAIGAAAHLARLILGFGIVIGGIDLPTWVSLPAGLVAAGLALWMVAAARR